MGITRYICSHCGAGFGNSDNEDIEAQYKIYLKHLKDVHNRDRP